MKTDDLKGKGQDQPVLGIGWYKESQWNLLLEHAVDREDLEQTYGEWLEGILEGIENFSKAGIHCEKIPIDVAEMITWCKDNGYPFDGPSRSVFIARKTRHIYG
ncbi:MAG: hypothetical protein GQ542_04985 [Desulforhopalus sp.]|nr:hypothetical protein [Desulforhopalus sp.]